MAEGDGAAAEAAAANAGAQEQGKGAADAAKQNGGSAASAGGSEQDWRAGIEDEKVRDFAGRFTTPKDLAKAGYDLRQKLSQAIFKPGKDAKPEDVSAYHKALGVPDKIDAYKALLPAELPDTLKTEEAQKGFEAFFTRMKSAGATPDVVKEALGFYLEQPGIGDPKVAAAVDAVLELQGAAEKTDETLKAEWGLDADANMNAAKAAVVKFGGEELRDYLDASGLGNHPALIRAFARMGRATITEDEFRTAPDSTRLESIDEEIAKLRALQTGSPAEQRRWADQATQNRLFELYDRKGRLQGRAA